MLAYTLLIYYFCSKMIPAVSRKTFLETFPWKATFCFVSDDYGFVQMWMNASAVRVHTSVTILSEVSAVDVLTASGYWMMAGHALLLMVGYS